MKKKSAAQKQLNALATKADLEEMGAYIIDAISNIVYKKVKRSP